MHPRCKIRLSLAVFLAAPFLAAASPPPDGDGLLLVRVAEARKTSMVEDVVFSGDIQPQAQVNVSFRTNGKVAKRLVEVGDHVSADQVIAELEPLTQRANLDNSRAALSSAEAQLTQAKLTFERQKQLLGGGYTTRSTYDNAEQDLRTAQAAVESGKAALGTAQEQLNYTELRAGVEGIVTRRDFEVGQVVQSGQTVLVLAQDGLRDAVFNVYEALTARPPGNKVVEVSLQADPSVKTRGTVREISPTVDASSGTVRVKIRARIDPAGHEPRRGGGRARDVHAERRDRAAVVGPLPLREPAGGVGLRSGEAGRLRAQGRHRPLRAERHHPEIRHRAGEQVVVAGIQFLRPGQTVAAIALGETPLQGAAVTGERR